MSKINYSRMNEKDWKIIRTLRENGCSIKQVTDITGRASDTQNVVMRSTDFEDYQRLSSENARRWNKEYQPGGRLYKPTEAEIDQNLKEMATGFSEIVGATEPSDSNQIAEPQPVMEKPTTRQDAVLDGYLERIAVALERMADAWEKSPTEPTKRGIFSR